VRPDGDIKLNLKKACYLQPAGIEDRNNYSIASNERAFLDVLPLNKDYHFDNLAPLDWDKVFEILPMYGNKRMAKKAAEYHRVLKDKK